MKKYIAFTLIVFLLGAAFVACGDEKSTSAPDSTESSESRLYLSSSVVKTYLSSSSKKAITPADVTHGSFVDERDGQSYKTVAIGEQVWMAENLNYASESSFCYYGLDEACKNAGRLYTYEAAEKVCPKGYRLPTREDFAIMLRPLSERIQEASLDWSYYMAPFGIMSKEGWNECTQSFVGGVTYPAPTNSTGFPQLVLAIDRLMVLLWIWVSVPFFGVLQTALKKILKTLWNLIIAVFLLNFIGGRKKRRFQYDA
ncbi:MAG: hypothetical protein IKG78_16440 [Fibrobacter sp.]|nr:FISUMP domain-containing protein [Fibrobacter sp.]MBR3073368.1 hypothetical protein [Fibrobacter sp.]